MRERSASSILTSFVSELRAHLYAFDVLYRLWIESGPTGSCTSSQVGKGARQGSGYTMETRGERGWPAGPGPLRSHTALSRQRYIGKHTRIQPYQDPTIPCPRVETLIDVASVVPYRRERGGVQSRNALAGRAGLRDGRPRTRAGWVGVDRVGHPADLPEGYHALPRGQAWHARPVADSKCCPRGTAWSGYARSTGCPTGLSVQDHQVAAGQRNLRHADAWADAGLGRV
jgi:hypothetical protein